MKGQYKVRVCVPHMPYQTMNIILLMTTLGVPHSTSDKQPLMFGQPNKNILVKWGDIL